MTTIMDRRQLVLLLSTLAALQVCVTASACNIPSRFWCDSKEIALECGVYDQCKKNEWTLNQDAAPVNFALYYESLCPYCKNFITTMLYPTYLKLSSITNLTLIPYGNADETLVNNRWQFTCQHGAQECVGNIIATCTIAIVKNIDVYFPFLNCLEASNLQPTPAAQQCATQFNVPLNEILNCTTSDYGNQLEHQMALRTDALVPTHTYVPWVTLNGVHSEAIQSEAQSNLPKLLCDAYKGVKPAACSSL
ncbi:unnamed protein product [Candidula unifasciata]|uniref:Saposin A-type domain-containing protein n=1 Tax=Candidula unifasciata TaxID=100452 RepID=A0A8S3ZXV4_9EUPU|nr:unnamed protein product [Candidula unifasciata]